MTEGSSRPPLEEVTRPEVSNRTYPCFVPTWIHGGVLYFTNPGDVHKTEFRWNSQRDRGLVRNKSRQIVGLILEERTEHYIARISGKPTDDIPEFDLRRLPKSVPPVEVLAPLVSEWGLPYVDNDLIPE